MIKKILILTVILYFCFAFYSPAQNTDELHSVFQNGDSAAICNYLRKLTGEEAQIRTKAEKDNDTIAAIDQIVSLIALNYLNNNLRGLSDYREYVERDLRIFLQSEVEVAVFPEFDYREIFAGKYERSWQCVLEDSRSTKEVTFAELVSEKYSQIPNLKAKKKFSFNPVRTDNWKRQDFDRVIKIDTLQMKALEDELNLNIHRQNIDELKKVIYTHSSRKGDKFYLDYNFTIDRIIFNPQLDQALIQFYTRRKSVYEFLFLKVGGNNKKWELAVKREKAHFD